MPANEFFVSEVPEFDRPVEMPASEEFKARAPEYADAGSTDPVMNEFEEVPPPRGNPENQARAERKKARRKKNLLLQAAAIGASVVLTTSAMGIDILGDELSGGILNEALRNAGAKKGEITVSMLWSTTDDLDLHVVTPDGTEIYYGNSVAAGGELDVDMQVSSFVEHPVENIYFETPEHGTYHVFVENYSDRNEGDPQVLIQVTVRGRTKSYTITLDSYRKEICSFGY